MTLIFLNHQPNSVDFSHFKMTELLAVHPKKTADIDIARPLSNWISSTFGSSDDPIDASSDVEEFQRLRQAVARLSDTGENGLSSLSK